MDFSNSWLILKRISRVFSGTPPSRAAAQEPDGAEKLVCGFFLPLAREEALQVLGTLPLVSFQTSGHKKLTNLGQCPGLTFGNLLELPFQRSGHPEANLLILLTHRRLDSSRAESA